MSVQFEEEPMPTTEIGESSTPPSPFTVNEEDDKFYDSDMYDNDDLISDTNILIRTNLETNTIHVVGNPSDPRRTRSQLKSDLCMKDPLFAEKCYLMVE